MALLFPSDAANARANAGVLRIPLRPLLTLRMSKIGTTLSPLCNGTELTENATSSGVWECTIAITSGRAL